MGMDFLTLISVIRDIRGKNICLVLARRYDLSNYNAGTIHSEASEREG